MRWPGYFAIVSSVAVATAVLTFGYAPSGSFENLATKPGVVTEFSSATRFDGESAKKNGVELNYMVAPTTPQCTQIAIIQMTWCTDASGAIHKQTDIPEAVPAAPDMDEAAIGGGYVIDFKGGDRTPYYQDDGISGLRNGLLGSADGRGGGDPAHISDAPWAISRNGWTKHFEDWSVCTAGQNAGAVLAGITWRVNSDGTAQIIGRKPAAPSPQFYDALKSWVQWYNRKNPKAPFKEPGGGFKF